MLRAGWASFSSAIDALDDEAFDRRFARYTYAAGPKPDGVLARGEPGPFHPAAFLIVSIINEVSHHGARICALRDLYSHSR